MSPTTRARRQRTPDPAAAWVESLFPYRHREGPARPPVRACCRPRRWYEHHVELRLQPDGPDLVALSVVAWTRRHGTPWDHRSANLVALMRVSESEYPVAWGDALRVTQDLYEYHHGHPFSHAVAPAPPWGGHGGVVHPSLCWHDVHGNNLPPCQCGRVGSESR